MSIDRWYVIKFANDLYNQNHLITFFSLLRNKCNFIWCNWVSNAVRPFYWCYILLAAAKGITSPVNFIILWNCDHKRNFQQNHTVRLIWKKKKRNKSVNKEPNTCSGEIARFFFQTNQIRCKQLEIWNIALWFLSRSIT